MEMQGRDGCAAIDPGAASYQRDVAVMSWVGNMVVSIARSLAKYWSFGRVSRLRGIRQFFEIDLSCTRVVVIATRVASQLDRTVSIRFCCTALIAAWPFRLPVALKSITVPPLPKVLLYRDLVALSTLPRHGRCLASRSRVGVHRGIRWLSGGWLSGWSGVVDHHVLWNPRTSGMDVSDGLGRRDECRLSAT